MSSSWAQWVSTPREVSIETFTQCNARCVFCPYPTLDRKGQRMSDELLDKLVRELIAMPEGVTFSPFKVNEPLLDNRLIPLCERVNREAPHIRLRIFTNGTPLTPDKIGGLARLENVEHLWVSLNSHDPAEYERIMGMKFDLVSKRLDHLHAYEFPHPVVLSTVGWPNDAFRQYCAERWPNFRSVVLKQDAWIDYTQAQRPEVPDTACGRWFELSILSDGRVSLCCMDGTGKYQIGDVNTQTMLEVYNAPIWKRRRERMVSRRHVEDQPCSRCTY
jgi:radical SAM protein with 4Fe4S-binding SPASM domain